MPALALASVFFLLIAVLFGWSLLWFLMRLLFPREATFAVRIAALGITLVLWSSAIRVTLAALYSLLRQLVLFPFLMSGENVMRSLGQGESIFRALNKLLPDVNALLRTIDAIPVFQLILALLTLILVARALTALNTGVRPPWTEPFRNLKPAVWLNALVLTVFFAGIYLSVASLCTIPALQINQPFTDVEKSQINTQIDAGIPSDDTFKKQFPESLDLSGGDLGQLRALLITATGERFDSSCAGTETPAASPVASPVVPAPQSPTPATQLASSKHDATDIEEARQLLKAYDAERCNRLRAYQTFRSTIQQAERTEAEKAKNQIDSNFAVRLTGRDRADYIYSLEAGYQNSVSQMQAALSRCKSQAERTDPFLSFRAQFAEQLLRNPTGAAHNDATASLDNNYLVTPASYQAANACEFDALLLRGQSSAPAPQLGIFSFFFGWLEDSDSLALAIICGMLGVGLVGCIVSSFVRQQALTTQANAAVRASDAPWISDIFPVVVRGFTAAIVVYLAIEGGLNVVSSQTTQANPYVLLCACLVGAVFSENVWNAAHERFKQSTSAREPNEPEPDAHEAADRPGKPAKLLPNLPAADTTAAIHPTPPPTELPAEY